MARRQGIGWTRRGVLEAGAAAAMLPALGCHEPEEGREPPGGDGGDTDAPSVTADTDPGSVDTDVDPVDTDVDPVDTAPDEPPEVAFDPDAVPADARTFPSTVQAGAMTTRRAVLVTRTYGGLTEARARVWEDVAPGTVKLAFDGVSTAAGGGFHRVEVDGLLAGRLYRYAFFTVDDDGALVGRSDVGRFRTAPRDDDSPLLTIALMSCNSEKSGRKDAVGRIADHPEVDLIVHVGDMAYTDGSETLDQYRASWASWMTSAGYRAGFASAGLYATWDDHEVENDWDGQSVDPTQKAAAFQAYVEAVAVEPGVDGRLWQSYRWGSTAELFVLDCRSERKPSTRGQGDIYISIAQMDWLKAALAASPCRFKIVLNSVPITNMPGLFDFAQFDRWEGYPRQRDELLDHIRDTPVADVWFLTGDHHICFVSTVAPNATGTLGATREIAVTSGNTNILGDSLTAPQFPYGTSQPRLCLLAFDPAAGTVHVKFVDPDDGRVVWQRVLSQTP